MSVKIHILHSRVNCFSEILEAWQNSKESPSTKIKTMEKSYQGHWNTNKMANYCWCRKREVAGSSFSWKIQKKPISGLATMHYFLSWKKNMLSYLGNSWHFNAFLSPQSLHCKAIISVFCKSQLQVYNIH